MNFFKRLFQGKEPFDGETSLPTPPGSTTVTLKMSYGSSHTITFKGTSGRTSEQVAREYINGSGNFFDIGGGKFANARDIGSISMQSSEK